KAVEGSRPSADELVREFQTQAHAPFRAAARLATAEDPRIATNARTLLAYGVETALRPMLRIETTDPVLRAQVVAAVGAAAADLRERTRAWLKTQMTDKSLVPVPEGMQFAQPPPIARRVCDHAFLAMRRLMHPDEDLLVRMVDERLFENLPDEKKDAIIADAVRTERWIRPRAEYLAPQPGDTPKKR
ncbi:MAG: hypothetical protein HOV80_23425, partial [Polyangiaceae bacterium]|nr:hypothetical protein [Polyangiaceae bacterium]